MITPEEKTILEALLPEVFKELMKLAELAFHGAGEVEIASQAVRFATLAAYKQSYRGA